MINMLKNLHKDESGQDLIEQARAFIERAHISL